MYTYICAQALKQVIERCAEEKNKKDEKQFLNRTILGHLIIR